MISTIKKIMMISLVAAGIFLCVSCSSDIKAEESINSESAGTVDTHMTTMAETTISETGTSLSEISILDEGICNKLFIYLSDHANGGSVGEEAFKLNSGEWHNACVYVVSEALRDVGCDIPVSVNRTEDLVKELEDRGFETCYDLTDLQPGDICFTTDEEGNAGGRPTHTYVFLDWARSGEADIFDNQVYDYGDLYHTRYMELSYFDGQEDRPKEATAFHMRK